MSETKVILRALDNELSDCMDALKAQLPHKTLVREKNPKTGHWDYDARSKKIDEALPPNTPREIVSKDYHREDTTKVWPQLAALAKAQQRLRIYMNDLEEVRKQG